VPLATDVWKYSSIIFWAWRDSYPSPVPKSVSYWTAWSTDMIAGTDTSKATSQNTMISL